METTESEESLAINHAKGAKLILETAWLEDSVIEVAFTSSTDDSDEGTTRPKQADVRGYLWCLRP